MMDDEMNRDDALHDLLRHLLKSGPDEAQARKSLLYSHPVADIPPYVAGALAQELRSEANELDTVMRRIALLERALDADCTETSARWLAQQRYALAACLFKLGTLQPPSSSSRRCDCLLHADLSYAEMLRLGDPLCAADALALYCQALGELPEPQGGGRDHAIKRIQAALSDPALAHADSAQAVLFLAHANLLSSKGLRPGAEQRREAKRSFEQAATLFSQGIHSPEPMEREGNIERLIVACTSRAHLEHEELAAGVGGDFNIAMHWLDRAMDAAKTHEVHPLFVHAATLMVDILQTTASPPATALRWLDHALLEIPEHLLPPSSHIVLQWQRTKLLRLREQGTTLEEYEHCVQTLEAALKPSSHPLIPVFYAELVNELVQQHLSHSRQDEAVVASQIWEESDSEHFPPGITAQLLSLGLATLLHRDKGRDRLEAAKYLTRLLDLEASTQHDKGLHRQVYHRVSGAAERWVQEAACRWTPSELSRSPWQRLHTLWQHVLTPTRGSRESVRLKTLLSAVRSRVEGQPPAEECLAQLVSLADEPGQMYTQAEEARRSALQTAFLFGMRSLGIAHEKTQAVARQLEPLVLQSTDRSASEERVACLLELAAVRLAAPSDESLRHARAALKLLEFAQQNFSLESITPELRTHWRLCHLRARLSILVKEVERSPDDVLALAEELLTDILTLPEPHGKSLLERLCRLLWTFPALEPARLHARARALATQFRLTALLQRQDNRAQALQELFTDFAAPTTEESDHELCEIQADPELLASLERGEYLAAGAMVLPTLAVEAAQLLEPLLSRSTGHTRARVFRALGKAWANHPSGQRREALERAMRAFQSALQLWPAGDFESRVTVSLECIDVYWLYIDYDTGIFTPARELLETLLGANRLKEFPLLRAKVLFHQGRLERYDVRERTREQAQRAAIPYLRAALTWCPDEALDTDRFIFLVGLANAQRDLYLVDTNHERMGEKASAGYRAALELASRSGKIVDLEVARAQKCLADLLVARRRPEGLEEARLLLQQALLVRTAERDPIRRAETLVSVAQLELTLHAPERSPRLELARQAALEGLGLVSATRDAALHAGLTRLLHLVQFERIKAGVPQDAERHPTVDEIADSLLERPGKQPPAAIRADLRRGLTAMLRGDHDRSPLIKAAVAAAETFKRRLPDLKMEAPDPPSLSQWLDQCESLLVEADVNPGALADAHALCLLLSPAWLQQKRLWPEALWRRAVQIVRSVLQRAGLESVDWVQLAATRATLGRLLADDQYHRRSTQDEWYEGIHLLRQAVAEVEAHGAEAEADFPDYAIALWLALFHAPGPGRQTLLHEALILGDRALEVAKRLEQRDAWQTLLLNQATLLHQLEDEDPTFRERALACNDTLIATLREGGTPDNLWSCLSNRAWLLLKPGDASHSVLRDCLRDLEEAKSVVSAHPELNAGLGSILNHLGSCHHQLVKFEPDAGHLEKSLSNHQASTAHWETLNVPIESSRGLHNGALALLMHGPPDQHPKALTWLRRALELRSGRPMLEWETLRLLARARPGTGWPHASELTDAWMLERFDNLIPGLRGLGSAAGLLEAIMMRVRLHGAAVDSSAPEQLKQLQLVLREGLEDAERCWRTVTTFEAQHTCSNALGMLSAWLAVVGHRLGETPEKLLKHVARGRARTLVLARAARSSLPLTDAVLAWMNLQDERERLVADSSAHASARLLEVERALLRTMQDSGQEFLTLITDQVVTLQALEARLRRSPWTAFIELSHAGFGSVAVVAWLNRAGRLEVETRSIDVTEAELTRWNTIRTGYSSPGAPPGWSEILERLSTEVAGGGATDQWLEAAETCGKGMKRILQELYRRVLGPAVSGLRGRGVRRLVFSVSSPLDILPLAAACWIDEYHHDRFLIEEFESVTVSPSCAVFLSAQPQRIVPGDALLVAIDSQRTLPGFSERMKTLESLLKDAGHSVTTLGGSGEPNGKKRVATVELVHRALQRADMAHLLCHGSFHDTDLYRAGLLLENAELLSCARLIQSPERLHASLVVVSACNSGRSRAAHQGGDWLGFSGALLRAGAKTVIAGLWNIHYVSSSHLLEVFHEALLEHPDPALALGRAMRIALDDARLALSGERMRHPLLDSLRGPRRAQVARLLALPLMWGQFGMLEG